MEASLVLSSVNVLSLVPNIPLNNPVVLARSSVCSVSIIECTFQDMSLKSCPVLHDFWGNAYQVSASSFRNIGGEFLICFILD
jgi:hypothetical protein